MATIPKSPQQHIFTIAGIPVYLDVTFLLAIVTIAFAASQRSLPSLTHYVLLAVLVIAGVFLSILAHEFGHAFAGRRFGLATEEIVIGGFFGFAVLVGQPERSRDSILVLLAGPLANMLAAILLWFAIGAPELSGNGAIAPSSPASPLAGWPVLNLAARWLLFVNLAMAMFNLLPVFPLDGGRIARIVLRRVVADGKAIRCIAALGMFISAWLCFAILQYPVLLMIAPVLMFVNYDIWKDRDFPLD